MNHEFNPAIQFRDNFCHPQIIFLSNMSRLILVNTQKRFQQIQNLKIFILETLSIEKRNV